MSDGIVQRLIAFLKKPDALTHDESVHNEYDDFYEDYNAEQTSDDDAPAVDAHPEAAQYADDHSENESVSFEPDRLETPVFDYATSSEDHASRIDALIMRALRQFNATTGAVLSLANGGEELHYCTGRNQHGKYLSLDASELDRRALFLALDSGEANDDAAGANVEKVSGKPSGRLFRIEIVWQMDQSRSRRLKSVSASAIG